MSHSGVHEIMLWQFNISTWTIHSSGVHVRILWWFRSATWVIQEEFTWESCDEFIVQHWLFRESSHENAVMIPLCNMSYFERSSRANATPITSSKMNHPGRVHNSMLWLFHCRIWAIHSGGVHGKMFWWFRIPTLAIQEEFTWEWIDDSR